MADPYGTAPGRGESQLKASYGNSDYQDFAHGNPSASESSPLAQSQGYQSDEPHSVGVNRSASTASTAVGRQSTPSRNNTLKKKASVKRMGSLKRSSSRKSLAGSIKGVGNSADEQDYNNVFFTPIPTQGSPTEILANRFQAWRQLLKSLLAYFREIQSSYDTRAKAIHKVQGTIAGIAHPSVFITDHGLGEATRILEDYHKHSIVEANKSRDIENDVIGALTGLRSDLGQKIKEIKGLSGDFKNSVEKEKESTRRAVDAYQEALQHANHEDGASVGKNDPFVVRLGVDRAVEKQIDEENYLHRAYLNLESSGRELESIVVGEIQKAYNALAGILKREGDDAYHVVETLRSGPISMPKDQEWSSFVHAEPHFVPADTPVRRVEDITYPGKDNPAAAEIRAGMLERKSKYLKSYTPGWYVLSPTHLHEFKSADKIYTQPPVMSLYLGDQRLGSHSEAGSSSQKFMLKGKQAGGAHRGHSWVFRAESHDTMVAWYNDIKTLTESTGEERTAFVRQHARSVSGNSERPRSISSDGLEEDEADAVPFTADAASLAEQHPVESRPVRPMPGELMNVCLASIGGRFPSDLNIHRSGAMSPSSEADSDDRDVVAAAATLPGHPQEHSRALPADDPYRLQGVASGSRVASRESEAPPPVFGSSQGKERERATAPETYAPTQGYAAQQQASKSAAPFGEARQPLSQPQQLPQQHFQPQQPSNNNDWVAPAALGAGAGVVGTEAYRHRQDEPAPQPMDEQEHGEAFPSSTQSVEAQLAQREATQVAAPDVPTPATEQPHASSNGAFGAANLGARPGAGAMTIEDYRKLSEDADMTSRSPPTAALPLATEQQLPSRAAEPSIGNGASSSSSGFALGGLEAEGAHETGALFPRVIRHDTDISVSRLHIPGEFPKRG
nr:hypothetical protein B0A51_17136 [Rachicladosporium sp. CCFEE 5018]